MNTVELNDFYNGPFAMYQSREFTDPEGVDPWIPCSLAYTSTSWSGSVRATGGWPENTCCNTTFDPNKPCWFDETADNGQVLIPGDPACVYESYQSGGLNIPVYT